jgi:urate oxidase
MKAPIVATQSYGKSQVRVSRIERQGSRHEFAEMTISIDLDGDFGSSYSAADNSNVVPTDTMKNTVYALASRHGIRSAEAFTQLLAHHFLETYSHVNRVTIRCEQIVWSRLDFNGKAHNHAFIGGSSERNTCTLSASRSQTAMHSGLIGLQVLKSTGSGFTGYLHDEYTTLKPTDDRIFATAIAAQWPCQDLAADWTTTRQSIRAALLDVFANQYSKSVQHTLYEMARAAFAACPLIDEIEIRMPNQHHLLANLEPFGLKNPNEVFVPTSEPFGNIGATIRRGEL